MYIEQDNYPGQTVWDSKDNEINILVYWTEETHSEDIGYDDVQILERTTIFTIKKVIFQNRSERPITKKDISLSELVDILSEVLDTFNIEQAVSDYYETLLD